MDASGNGPAFTPSGSNFTETASVGSYRDEFMLESAGPNLKLRRRQPRYAVSYPVSDASVGAHRPPYAAWHAGDGLTFEPDPASTNSYRLASIAGPDGYDMFLYYNTNSCITSVVDAASNTYAFSYSTDGYLTNVTDVTSNRHAIFSYSNDLLVSVTDMGGQTNLYGYNPTNGFLTSLKRPSLSGYDETTISYDGDYTAGTKVTITYPEGNQTYVEWGSGSIMGNTLRSEGETKSTYESYSWGLTRTEIEDPLGRLTSFVFYDNTNSVIMGWIKKIVKPDGSIEEYQYDDQGKVSQLLSYDSSTNLVSVTGIGRSYFPGTDCLSAITNEIRNAEGNVLSRAVTAYSRFENGTTNDGSDDVYTLVSEKFWIAGNQYAETRYIYDTNTWLLTEIQKLVSGTNNYRTVKTFTYNANRQLTSVSDALTNTTFYAYDSLCRITNITFAPPAGSARASSYFYDSLDRLTNLVHPDGISETWKHAPCGCGILSHVDRGGNVTSNSYSPNKWLSKVRTWSSNGTLVSYVEYKHNAAGQITNAIDALTNIFAREYNSAGDLVKSTDPLGPVTEHQYDSAGRKYLTIYPGGTISSNAYDSAGNVASSALIGGTMVNLTQYSRDALGRVITTTDALGNITSNTFDMAGRTVRITYPDQSCQETVFDLLGNVVEQIGPVPAGASQAEKDTATTSNSYDLLNRLVSTTDPESRTTTYEYSTDWPQQIARVKNDNGQVVQENFYDAQSGNMVSNTSYGVLSSFEYDNAGQVISTIFADGSASTNTYDGPRLVSQRSRTGNVTSYGFDALGRRTSVTNSLGAVTHYAFDAIGNVTNMTDALTNRTSYVFDSMNRPTVTIRPDGSASTNSYDSLGRLASRTGAGSVPVSYQYDLLARMTNLIDGEANSTKFEYDSMGRLSRKIYADGTFYQYSYSARGWLTNRLDAVGKNTRYSYNNVGQLTEVDYPTDTDVHYVMDNLGRMSQRVDSAGTWSWTYQDQSSRILSETLSSVTSVLSVVNYTYSPTTFDLASVSCGSYTTLYSWAAGRLTDVSVSSVDSVRDFSYSYLANSDLLETATYLNGTVTVHRAYDDLSRLTNISSVFSVPSVVNSFSYSLDNLGRRTARADSDGSQTSWGYDKYDQLISASRTNGPNGAADAAYNFGYQYDQVGNRLHEDRGQLDLDGRHNNLNQLTHLAWAGKQDILGQIKGTNYPYTVKVQGTNAAIYNNTNFLGGATVQPGSNTISIVTRDATSTTETTRVVHMPPTNPQLLRYDLNGNLTNDGQKAYFWDEENRLTAIDSVVGPKRRSEYGYDGMGRRVQKADLSGWTGSAYATTNVHTFVYDGWNLLSELITDNGSPITDIYVWGLDLSQSLQGAGGIGGLLCVIRNSTPYFPLSDGNGNITDYVDGTGAVVAHREYDPFGRTVVSTGPMKDAFSFWFSNKYFEPWWNLYYYGRRLYNPTTGRWLNRDPIEERGGANLYGFVGNDSVCAVDVRGLYVLHLPWYWSSKSADACAAAFDSLIIPVQNLISFLQDQIQKAMDLPQGTCYEKPLKQEINYAIAIMQSIDAGLDSADDVYVGDYTAGNTGYYLDVLPFGGLNGPYIGLSDKSDTSMILHELTHVYGSDDLYGPPSLYDATILEGLLTDPSGTMDSVIKHLKRENPGDCCK